MSSEVQCPALNNAIRNKGVSLPQVAQSVGSSEERVKDIVSGRARPTQQELNNLQRSLEINRSAPHDAAHTPAN